jgi:hypothetical protein
MQANTSSTCSSELSGSSSSISESLARVQSQDGGLRTPTLYRSASALSGRIAVMDIVALARRAALATAACFVMLSLYHLTNGTSTENCVA